MRRDHPKTDEIVSRASFLDAEDVAAGLVIRYMRTNHGSVHPIAAIARDLGYARLQLSDGRAYMLYSHVAYTVNHHNSNNSILAPTGAVLMNAGHNSGCVLLPRHNEEDQYYEAG